MGHYGVCLLQVYVASLIFASKTGAYSSGALWSLSLANL